MTKILLGIQPTGRLHIGNYFGALKKGLEMQEEGNEVKLLVANIHANTDEDTDYDFQVALHQLGFNNTNTQSDDNLRLFYKLAHSTNVAELSRLPQYQTSNEAKRTLHMLSYPLLMAADIIISGCDAVIVGDDQTPHMNFYRDIAERNGYKIAETIKSDTPRIMSIKDPSKKMSKSLGDAHCIYLDDDFDTICKKLASSPTSEDGVNNLKLIASLYGVGYDEKNNQVSKNVLANAISEYKYGI